MSLTVGFCTFTRLAGNLIPAAIEILPDFCHILQSLRRGVLEP
jgi:hypothetical protein